MRGRAPRKSASGSREVLFLRWRTARLVVPSPFRSGPAPTFVPDEPPRGFRELQLFQLPYRRSASGSFPLFFVVFHLFLCVFDACAQEDWHVFKVLVVLFFIDFRVGFLLLGFFIRNLHLLRNMFICNLRDNTGHEWEPI